MIALLHRHAYELRSRNLRLGVYSEASNGFYGIRTKFDSRFIDQEYAGHTAFALSDLGIVLPDEIELRENERGSLCGHCLDLKREVPVRFDEARRPAWPWTHYDNPTLDAEHKAYGIVRKNRPLFDFLDKLEGQ